MATSCGASVDKPDLRFLQVGVRYSCCRFRGPCAEIQLTTQTCELSRSSVVEVRGTFGQNLSAVLCKVQWRVLIARLRVECLQFWCVSATVVAKALALRFSAMAGEEGEVLLWVCRLS